MPTNWPTCSTACRFSRSDDAAWPKAPCRQRLPTPAVDSASPAGLSAGLAVRRQYARTAWGHQRLMQDSSENGLVGLGNTPLRPTRINSCESSDAAMVV